MAKQDLLAEAIADAKKVKKTALANAKMALEEAFQPTLQRMISTKLAEEDELDDDFDLSIEIEPELSVAPEGGDDLGGEEPVGMGSFEDDEPVDAPAPEGGDDLGGDDAPAPEGEEDMELESLIRELEGEDEFADDEFLPEGEEEDWQDPIPDDPMNEADGYDDEFKSGDNELTEAEVRALTSLFEEEGLGDINGPEDEDGGSFTLDVPSTNINFESRVRKLRSENRKLRESYNKAMRVVTSLKKTINEVNLLNAKLMYTTKAMKLKESMSQSQQVRVMEAIDRGRTVREVQLIYTSIMEALNKRPSRTLTEGLASKTVKPMGKPVLKESKNSDVIKWQRLAGILPPADY